MSNMYTSIAYLIEIRKFCSKNLVHKGVNFEAQNAQTHPQAPLISKKKFRGLYPRTPVKRGRGKGKASPYSTTERRVPETIPVLGSQPAGDLDLL